MQVHRILVRPFLKSHAVLRYQPCYLLSCFNNTGTAYFASNVLAVITPVSATMPPTIRPCSKNPIPAPDPCFVGVSGFDDSTSIFLRETFEDESKRSQSRSCSNREDMYSGDAFEKSCWVYRGWMEGGSVQDVGAEGPTFVWQRNVSLFVA